ncbi:Protein cwh43 like protein [Verticillium longisporum]|nr:Protein cwh43 like protein [Verticillium longisporum]
MMLLIGLGVLGLGSTTAQSRRKKAQRPSASVFRHRKFHSAAAIAVNLFFLSAAFLRFPTNDYKPYHGEDRVMTAGVWTIHFALDNDMCPSNFSAGSGRSPSTQEGFYTHQPTQTATYALHAASPVDHAQQHAPQHQPQPQIVPYAQQVSTQVPAPQAQAPQPVQQQVQQMSQHYPSPSPQPQAVAEDYWNGAAYQAPVEVATIGSLPTFGSGTYDLWGPKIEFEDPSMQLPSARIENM